MIGGSSSGDHDTGDGGVEGGTRDVSRLQIPSGDDCRLYLFPSITGEWEEGYLEGRGVLIR